MYSSLVKKSVIFCNCDKWVGVQNKRNDVWRMV